MKTKSKNRPQTAGRADADAGETRCCKMCGIADGETPSLMGCRVVKLDVCGPCCLSVGGPHHSECKECPWGKPYWASEAACEIERHEEDRYLTPFG